MSIRKEVTFGPDNAMNSLTRSASDGANRETLRRFFRIAVIALGFALLMISFDNRGRSEHHYLFDYLHLAVEPSCSALY